MIEAAVSLTQYRSTAPQTTSSKMTILNQHLSKTVATKTQHYSLYCRTVVLAALDLVRWP